MMLVEETQVAEASLPLAAFKSHLALGSGFAEDDLQDAVLVSFLRAALAAIEGRTSKALISRGFLLMLEDWKQRTAQRLPIAPITSITEIALIDAFGSDTVVDPSAYRLRMDAFDPTIVPIAALLPRVPDSGSVEIRFQAGYGTTFDVVPDDLKQAVLLLAAHYYEYRNETGLGQGCMPFGVTSLITRYRPVRIGLNA